MPASPPPTLILKTYVQPVQHHQFRNNILTNIDGIDGIGAEIAADPRYGVLFPGFCLF